MTEPRIETRVRRAVARGCEAAPEIADALRVSVVVASAALERLREAGDLDRESEPTFRSRRGRHLAYFRYRVKR